MAPQLGISENLTMKHWGVIRYIRATFAEYGVCPLVYHMQGQRTEDPRSPGAVSHRLPARSLPSCGRHVPAGIPRVGIVARGRGSTRRGAA